MILHTRILPPNVTSGLKSDILFQWALFEIHLRLQHSRQPLHQRSYDEKQSAASRQDESATIYHEAISNIIFIERTNFLRYLHGN